MINRALIFIKPHAVRPKAVRFIEEFLAGKNITLMQAGELTSETIREKGIIDRHYFAIARAAVEESPLESVRSDEAKRAFSIAFGLSLTKAAADGHAVNSAEAQRRLGGICGSELNRLWSAGNQAKLGPGLYAGRLEGSELIVINGFYPAMKERFTAPGLTIRWYDASFDPALLSWADFRGEVIGATKPDQAVQGSLRSELLLRYREFGLDEAPGMTNNGVHASAGPIEGTREQMVWLDVDPASSDLGKALFESGLRKEEFDRLLENGPARFKGQRGPVFDITEDVDAQDIPGNLEIS
jgi:nucleoside diphosphate kinase